MGELSEFSIVPRVVWLGCRPIEVRVYCALASYVDWETGVCWPSRATIAEALGVSTSTVDRALAGLAKAGVVRVRKRKSAVGDHDSNVYELPFAVNRRFGGSRKNAATWPQKRGGGSRKNEPYNKNQEREGLTQPKTEPDDCAHRPVDDDGYCTACRTTIKEEDHV